MVGHNRLFSKDRHSRTAQVCLQHLQQTFQHGGRKILLGAKEVEEITSGRNLRRQVYGLPGGHKRVISTKIVTVAEEIIQEICTEMNIRSPAEQQEFSLCYVTETGCLNLYMR